jgi:hypothetical protein
MKSNNNIENKLYFPAGNPFKEPEGYFDNLHERVMSRIKADVNDRAILHKESRKIYLRPYLSLAASISGLALIIYIVFQSIVGNELLEEPYYDLAFLEEVGIISNESIIAESYADDYASYMDWEKDAITYLASNEVDLMSLLETK